MQIAKQAVKSSPDIREELTARLKAQIQSGTYEVSAESFADKLIQKMEEV
ncbi:MAG: flagellar biosynthesis anti-sigma factor FlgM [Lachnospiraceae bacterium]|nr:flagellar biosynthesis anti-sigma factor FlgM [Lachnospiraceae bacterium]